jgi:hypothetical protein
MLRNQAAVKICLHHDRLVTLTCQVGLTAHCDPYGFAAKHIHSPYLEESSTRSTDGGMPLVR